MAPELALDKIELLTRRGATVLDPMCGSGTVVRIAAESGRAAIGADLDPLSVIITNTACHGAWASELGERAKGVLRRARRLGGQLPEWIKRDPETAAVVSYWFAPEQAEDLSRIARVLAKAPRSDDPLRVAFSRMIVTKDRGASLARDTSHSRPHRVADDNDYDVFEEFIRSAKKLEALIDTARKRHRPKVRRADARGLYFIPASSVDLTVTSPPYLNAIDYLRGHKLSLVWMGWTANEIRAIRGESVGAERMLLDVAPEVRAIAETAVAPLTDLPQRHQGLVLRFTHDMDRLARSLARVTKRKRHLVMVVANSQVKGVAISNAAICEGVVQRHGFDLVDETTRPLPARHRYLPPPAATSGTLAQRMNDEIVYTFCRR
jgi:DNA methylase